MALFFQLNLHEFLTTVGLTLVITEEFGTEVQTYWAKSEFEELGYALDDLRSREGLTGAKGIGYVDVINKKVYSIISDELKNKIEEWAKLKKIDAVIWTDLKSNFEEKINTEFCIDNAMSYLKNLDNEEFERAKDYILKAPTQTQTQLKNEYLQYLKFKL